MINKRIKENPKRYILLMAICIGLLHSGTQLLYTDRTIQMGIGGILLISGLVVSIYTVLDSMC